jgi:hypothetical protein
MALSASAASDPIATEGAALVDLKPIAVVDSKSVAGLTSPYGLAAVPAGMSGGGVFVGDRKQRSAPVQIDAAGREVQWLGAVVPPVQSMSVAHGKLFVLSASTVHVISIATGKEVGTVETIGADGQPVALRTPWDVLIVDEMMVVAESAHAVSIWPLPPQFGSE